MLDLMIASILAVILAPILVMIAAAVAIDTRGPVLFRQERSGLHGRTFTILKFRTMKVAAAHDDLRQATPDDGRITRVGYFLRRGSLDELPQLFNVLKGEMSLVGPRPHAVVHDRAFDELVDRYHWRFRARPGLTGLSQVVGLRGELRTPECLSNRVETDNHYIETWSLALDLKILAQTALIVLADKRAY